MIRGITLFWLAIAAMLIATLFGITYTVQERERELARLKRAIQSDQEAIHVLRAEWAYLNQPDRLRALNERYLGLAPVPGARLVGVADLPARLPKPDPVETPALAAAPGRPGAGLPLRTAAVRLPVKPPAKPPVGTGPKLPAMAVSTPFARPGVR